MRSLPNIQKQTEERIWNQHSVPERLEKKEGGSKDIKLERLDVADKVRLYDGKKWSIKGTIIKVLDYPRSFLILKS